MRWIGHRLHADAELDVDPATSLSDAHRIAHDAARANQPATDLELRLDQKNAIRLVREMRPERLEDFIERNKGNVGNRDLDRIGKESLLAVTKIRALNVDDALIGAKFPRQLAVSDVERINSCGAALKQAVGEPAGRRADIERNLSLDIERRKAIERAGKLITAARHVLSRHTRDLHIGIEARPPGTRTEDAERTMTLFAREVMPVLKAEASKRKV